MLILGLQKTTLLDYPHKVASTIFTGGCNFRCPYCHNKDLVLRPNSLSPFSENDIFEHLEKKKKVLDGVCITGGEPTLNPDLYDFIYKIKSLGLLVKLDTNGTNPKIIEKLYKDKLIDAIAMDIKQCPEKYNEIACYQSFDLDVINASVNIIKNSLLDYEFRTTVVNELHSIDDMVSIGNWLKGCNKYYIQSYKDSDQVIDRRFSSPSVEDLNKIINAVKPLIPSVELRGVD